uniref:Uncharacterized protein n=1 Tax=viral metagenome TaxID=1070528 RepID=A0A6H1ZFH6_9ZZZZ
MSGLNWEKANRLRKRRLSVVDEKERLDLDAAARWLSQKARQEVGAAKRKRARR